MREINPDFCRTSWFAIAPFGTFSLLSIFTRVTTSLPTDVVITVVRRPLPSIASHPSHDNLEIGHKYKVNEYKIAENISSKVSILTYHVMSKSSPLRLFVIVRLSLVLELDSLSKF